MVMKASEGSGSPKRIQRKHWLIGVAVLLLLLFVGIAVSESEDHVLSNLSAEEEQGYAALERFFQKLASIAIERRTRETVGRMCFDTTADIRIIENVWSGEDDDIPLARTAAVSVSERTGVPMEELMDALQFCEEVFVLMDDVRALLNNS